MKKIDEIADLYINKDTTFTVDERLLDIMATKVMEKVKGPSVLEMGVGLQVWTDKIIKKFGKSTAVDASEKLLKKAKEMYGSKLETHHSWFETFEPEKKFDSIIASLVLEHVDEPVLVLKQIKNWVKKDGQIIIIVPNASSIHRQYGVSLGLLESEESLNEADIKLGYKRVYTKETFEHDLKQAGYSKYNQYPTFTKFLSNAQMSEFSDHQLNSLFHLAEKLPLTLSGNLYYICEMN